MRFVARESAIFGQPEAGLGLIPGAGGIQHLTRLMGRARALEVMLSAEDYDAELAERYGWINRASSRTGSMRSRSRPPRTSAAIQISSARPRATPRPNARPKPR